MAGGESRSGSGAREVVGFDSAGSRCEATLYRPAGLGVADGASGPDDRGRAGSTPIVVLAHGFGMVREAGLDVYAERFAAAGYGALVFDYRHWGGSEGEPRELLDVERQLADWRAAIDYARSLAWVDAERVALWGSSFSGGHVAAIAASDDRLAAVISQVPFAGLGERQGPRRPLFMAKLIGAALRDELAGRLGRAPAYLPVTAPPGSPALFEVPADDDPLAALLPERHGWRNRFTPRVLLRLPRYRPFEGAERISCPWLLCVCDADVVTPAERAIERSQPAPRLRVERYRGEHFEVYSGEGLQRALADQLDFLAEALGE